VRQKVNRKLKLNKIEHHLLSMQGNESEPLFILYADTIRDYKGATLDIVLESLIKLNTLGYSECIIKEEEDEKGKWRICNNLTIGDLKKRFKGQSEEEKVNYPSHTNEYYFQITDKGRKEEAKKIYDTYYSQK
jgi:hypothetical protein